MTARTGIRPIPTNASLRNRQRWSALLGEGFVPIGSYGANAWTHRDHPHTHFTTAGALATVKKERGALGKADFPIGDGRRVVVRERALGRFEVMLIDNSFDGDCALLQEWIDQWFTATMEMAAYSTEMLGESVGYGGGRESVVYPVPRRLADAVVPSLVNRLTAHARRCPGCRP